MVNIQIQSGNYNAGVAQSGMAQAWNSLQSACDLKGSEGSNPSPGASDNLLSLRLRQKESAISRLFCMPYYNYNNNSGDGTEATQEYLMAFSISLGSSMYLHWLLMLRYRSCIMRIVSSKRKVFSQKCGTNIKSKKPILQNEYIFNLLISYFLIYLFE